MLYHSSSFTISRISLAVVSSVINVSIQFVRRAALITCTFLAPHATRITFGIPFRHSTLALSKRSDNGQLSQDQSSLIGFIAISPINPSARSICISSFVICPLVHIVDCSVNSPTPSTAILHFFINSKEALILLSCISIFFVSSCSTTTGAYNI